MKWITLFLIICLILLFAAALVWEIKDIVRIGNKRNVYDITDPEEKEKEYIFYSTFNYENAVTWRSLYISAFVGAILIYYVLSATGNKISAEIALVLLFIIFFVLYYMDNFRSFHIWRIQASKIRPRDVL